MGVGGRALWLLAADHLYVYIYTYIATYLHSQMHAKIHALIYKQKHKDMGRLTITPKQ